MSFCAFADVSGVHDVTPVENLFIREFMAHAPGEFVRVYLYGLMLCYYPAPDMSHERVARALGLQAEEVLNAFRYWERQGAVTRISDQPPAFQYLNLKAAMLSGPKEEQSLYRYRSFNNRLQTLIGAERLLHPHEYEKALEWVEDLKLPEDVVLRLVKSQLEKRGPKATFAGMEKVAVQWAEQEVNSLPAAEEMLEREGKSYQTAQNVLRQFNLRRSPTKDEQAFARKWLEEWGQTDEAIIAACRETVNASNPSFGYLDKVLSAHKVARTAKDMDRQLNDTRDLRNLVKQALRALGAQQSAPTDAQLGAYRRYLEAGFKHEGILAVADRLSARGRHSMNDLEGALTKCVELRLYTKQDIEGYLAGQRERRERAVPILSAAGLDREPTEGDIALIEEWLANADAALVAFAAKCARGTGTPLRYAERLLKSWREAGITDASAAEREYAARRTSQPPAGAAKPQPAALGYHQREYREGELDYLFMDLSAAPPKEDAP